MSETEIEPAKVKTQAQKYRSLIKTCQLLASVGSEGGMSTDENRHEQFQNILEQWQRGEEVVVFANDDFNEPPDGVNANLMNVDSRISPSAEIHINDSLPMNIVSPAEFSDTSSVILNLKNQSLEEKLDSNGIFKNEKKRGRKGAETTVVGIPKKKKLSTKPILYAKLLPKEKCKFILSRLVIVSAAESALGKKKLLTSSDVKKSSLIPDSLRDENSLDIQRVQIYFETTACKTVKRTIDEKKRCKWICFACNKFIEDGESIGCDSYLLWSHLSCTSLQKKPKTKYWFCNACRMDSVKEMMR